MIQVLNDKFCHFNPPILVAGIHEIFTKTDEILKPIPQHDRINIFYTLGHHSGIAAARSRGIRTKTTLEVQTVIAFDIDSSDKTKWREYAEVVSNQMHVPIDGLTMMGSGGGIHVIIHLKTPIRSADFFEENKDAYNELCFQMDRELAKRSLPGYFDTKIFDAARVLRMPGTENYKQERGITSTELLQYSPNQFDVNIRASSGIEDRAKENVSIQEIKRTYPTPDFNEMVKECRFMDWSIKNPTEIHEPHLFAAFSILAPQPLTAVTHIDGASLTPRDLAKRIWDSATSSESIRAGDFDKKWVQGSRYGGRKCQTINQVWEKCHTCPHFHKIPTPLALKGPEHVSTEATGYWHMNANGNPSVPAYADLAKVFQAECNPVTNSVGASFSYNGKYYEQLEPLDIKAWMQRKMIPADPLREAHRSEFANLVRTASHLSTGAWSDLFENSIVGKMNFANGILDIKTGELTEHTNSVGFKHVLPYKYTGETDSEPFRAWIGQMMLDRQELIDAALDVMAYCLWPTYDDHIFTILSGTGANGKSTYIHIMQAVVGLNNCGAIPMSHLGGNRFAAAQLDGKLINLSEESSGVDISVAEMNVIKALSSGSDIQVEQKGKDSYMMRNKAKLIFSCNEMPRFMEQSSAIKRRMMVIPFDYQIEKPDPSVEDYLLKYEIPNIAGMLVKRCMDNAKANGGVFKVSRGGDAAAAAQFDALASGHSAVQWAIEHIESKPEYSEDDFVIVNNAYMHYTNWCNMNGFRNPVSVLTFSKQLLATVITKQRDRGGTAERRVVGIGKTRVYPKTRPKEGVVI